MPSDRNETPRRPVAVVQIHAADFPAGRFLSVLLAALLALSLWAMAQSARAEGGDSGAVHSYDIPSGPLAQALNQFAQQAGITLSFTPDQAEGKQSAGLQGEYSIDEALRRLLSGTGLGAIRGAGDSYILQVMPESAGDTVLPAVMVEGQTATYLPGELPPAYAGGQVARGGSLGLMGNTDYMDTPFSVSSATEKYVRDVQAKELSDVLSYDASAQKIGGLSTPGLVFRGFSLATTESGVNGHYGLGNFNGYTEVQPFERIEVIRGPTAMLQGYVGGSTGASVNMVTKRAPEEPLARVSVFYETGSTTGTALDLGRRYGQAGEWGIRANGLYSDGSIGDEEQNHRNIVGSLALDYRGERLRASFDYIRHDQEGRGPYGCDVYDLNQEPDQSKCFLNTDEHMDITNEIFAAAVEYDITDRLRVSLSHARNYADAYFGATFYSFLTPPSGGMQPLMVQAFPLYRRPQSTQASVHWAFDTGAVKHEMTLGASYFTSKNYFFYDAYDIGVSIPEGTTPPDLAPPDPGAPLSDTETYKSYALVDRVSFQDGRYELIAGVRQQNVNTRPVGAEGYDESATSPSVAMMYRPVEQWMYYGSYIEGLKVGPTAPLEGPTPGTIYANGGEIFPPTRNKQYEAGVKWDRGNLGATLGVFQMTEMNEISVATGNPNVFVFAVDGERRHRGIELNVFGEPALGVRLLGSLTLMDAELTRTENGLRDGEEVIGVPGQKFVLNGEYDVPGLAGVALNGAMTAVSDANRDIGDPALGDTLPGYTIFDAGARYRTSIAGYATTLRLNVRNLLDREYFSAAFPNDGYLTFGQPRTVYMSAELEL